MTRVYGIHREGQWWAADTGVVFHTPFKEVACAQCHKLNANPLEGWQVRVFGERGNPRPCPAEERSGVNVTIEISGDKTMRPRRNELGEIVNWQKGASATSHRTWE